MKKSMNILFAFLLCASLAFGQREQIKIVGSSTVYPFSSSVAEEFGATSKFPTPVVESTGSGGGMKLFCAGSGMSTPDIANSSRRIKKKEFLLCLANGVKSITEVVIGYDGIAIAQDKDNKPLSLTRKHLLLAVAKKVPSKDGKSLIDNPYKNWNEIDKNLPNRQISVYGPPKSSGTRDAFEEMVLQALTKKMPVYGKKYSVIRTDGVYIPSGENDNLIVQKLQKDKEAIGIFGYSFLEENSDVVQGAKIDGVLPIASKISSGEYPISRSLFFYVKNSHLDKVKGLKEYVKLFTSDKMIGEDGILGEIGLIPLPQKQREKMRKNVLSYKKLKEKGLH